MSGRLLQQIGHRSDVVLVAVGEDEGDDVVEPVVEVAQRGEDEVDAGVVILREQHTTIHQGDLPVDLEGGHVATDVPEPSERDHPQRSWGQFGG